MSMFSDAELRARQAASQRAFYRALAGGSESASLVELDGVQATVVPVREWFSIFNSAFFDDAAGLDRAHAMLREAYAAGGVKAWTVWVPPGDDAAAAGLRRRGHLPDSKPMLFAAPIEAVDLESRTELDLDPHPSWELVARVNDRAHGVLE